MYGRQVVAPACSDPEDRHLLDEALTLFAYAEPKTSPAGHLLGQERKVELGVALLRAVRATLGRRELSALEDLYRQTKAVYNELITQFEVPEAGLLDVDKFIQQSDD